MLDSLSIKCNVVIKLVSSCFGLDLSPGTNITHYTRLYRPFPIAVHFHFPVLPMTFIMPHTKSFPIGYTCCFTNYMFFHETLFSFCFYDITIFILLTMSTLFHYYVTSPWKSLSCYLVIISSLFKTELCLFLASLLCLN